MLLLVFVTARFAKMNLLGSFVKSSGFSSWPFLLTSLQIALVKNKDGRFALKIADLASQSSLWVPLNKRRLREGAGTHSRKLCLLWCV